MGTQMCTEQGVLGPCTCGGMNTGGAPVAGGGFPAAGSTGVSGLTGNGGIIGAGGIVAMGGGFGVGGAFGTGGALETGGAFGTGGVTGTGGVPETGGATGTGGTADMCPPPPADAPPVAVEAWRITNQLRVPAGAGCANLVPTLIESAQSHCDYTVANAGNRSCAPDAHTEVSGCTGFTGQTVQAREIAAGYPSSLAYTEVAVTYGNNPTSAIASWLATPFHRIPLIDPWTTDMGYGGGTRCDVIDFGRGTSTVPADAVIVFPYDGQTGVPRTFNGLEAPAPPTPPSGWPSSFPVSIYAQAISVTEHVLTKDGDSTPLEHVWLDASTASSGLRAYFRTTAVLYGAPFEANAKYRVRISGTHTGGALSKEWTFTVGAR
jgi:hypothetical protein